MPPKFQKAKKEKLWAELVRNVQHFFLSVRGEERMGASCACQRGRTSALHNTHVVLEYRSRSLPPPSAYHIRIYLTGHSD